AAPAPAAQSVACTAPQNPAPQSRPAPSSSAPALSPSFSLQPHPCLSPRLNLLSSRPKWPGLFFRAAFWRAGPRSGGIVATPPPPRAQVNPPLLHSYTLTLLHFFLFAIQPRHSERSLRCKGWFHIARLLCDESLFLLGFLLFLCELCALCDLCVILRLSFNFQLLTLNDSLLFAS